MKTALLVVILSCIGITLGILYWENELKFLAPTPKPENVRDVSVGTHIPLTSAFENSSTPYLIHFFNPDCPCSRFNTQETLKLMRLHCQSFSYLVVIPEKESIVKAEEIFKEKGLKTKIIQDINGEWAKRYGVYSSPQAVVLSSTGYIYYKGNYNQSRYCTKPETAFCARAMESLLEQKTYLPQSAANTAYGCLLPHYIQ